MERLIIETPFYKSTEERKDRSTQFARQSVRKSLEDGNAPFSGVLLYSQVLDFKDPTQHRLAKVATEAWAAAADAILTFKTLDDLETFIRHKMPTPETQIMKRVIMESPYAGPTPEDIETNVQYAKACLLECLLRGEAPFASHLLYTQPGILRDEVPEERKWGIDSGLYMGKVAQTTIVYEDRGMSNGMKYGIANAEAAGRPIEVRKLSKT